MSRGCPAGHGHGYSSRAAAEFAVSGSVAVPKGAAGEPRECARCGRWYLHVPAVRTGFSAEVKLLARVRAGSGEASRAVCEACGIHLGRYGGDIQHRLARGSGGCSDEVASSLSNAAVLCRQHHAQAESRDPHMRDDAAGWWIRHGTGPASDPRLVPVLLYSEGTSVVRRWLHESEPVYLDEAPMGAAA